nr:hypothetical protein [uncultured Ralstonia sp.]
MDSLEYAEWYQQQLALVAKQQQWPANWQTAQNGGPLNAWNRMLQLVKPQAGLDSPNDPR